MKPRLSPRLRFALLWPILAAAAVAAPLLWFVVTGPLEEGTGILLLAVASALVLLGPVSWWLNRELFRPLKRIIAGAARLAAGDLASRVAVPEAAELGTLADSLNRLAGEVEAQIDLLAAERNELREILASMSEGVLMTDAEGRVRRVNDAFKRLFDLSGELVGRPVAEIGPELANLVATALQEGEPQCAELELKEPRRKILGLVGSPLPDHHGAVVAARDLTETLRLAEIRKDLVANVSHELKTPLTAIRGYAETLADGALDNAEVAGGFVRRILEQCARLEALLRDLLTLSRLESRRGPDRRTPDGRTPHPREAVDLGELARRAVEVLATQARAREVEVSLDVPATAPTIDGDREELERLLLNLVENAVKYNRPGGEVVVRLLADGAEVVIEVRDNGIGIPDDALERIFERFYRIDKGRSRDQGGTGLGLSIVKHAARVHGGRVEVESRLGVGSVFRVRLPQ